MPLGCEEVETMEHEKYRSTDIKSTDLQKNGPLLNWEKVGHYLHTHPRTASVVETVMYVSVSFTLTALLCEFAAGKSFQIYNRPGQVFQGGAVIEWREDRGRKNFCSQKDKKDIDELVK